MPLTAYSLSVQDPHDLKTVLGIGSSRKDLNSFPDEVKDLVGYALYQTQLGLKASSAKPLRGFGDAKVLEIAEEHQTDTYRAVYTVRFSEFVYVLPAFQKKSKRGVATPKPDIDLIKRRLRVAEADHHKRRIDRGSNEGEN